MVGVRGPQYPVDIFSDDVIREPYGHYREIRDLGSAVWLSEHRLWAVARFDDVRAALRADEILISGKGVAANPLMNRGGVAALVTDGELHREFRRVLMAPMSASEMRTLRPRLADAADSQIGRLVAGREFDGMRDLATFLPMTIVGHMVGLSDAGREKLFEWAIATFDAFGPLNARTRAGILGATEAARYVEGLDRHDVVSGSWADRLWDAADRGQIDASAVPGLLLDYVTPSLETTIFAIGHLFHLLGTHPEQWQALRADPELIPAAIAEALRMEAPIRAFTRFVARDFAVGDGLLPAGSRALILYASANRDERRYVEPDRFDIHRDNADHLGFGHGAHHCLGVHLAKLEMQCLLEAAVRQVETISVGEPTCLVNNMLRGFERLPMAFTPAGSS